MKALKQFDGDRLLRRIFTYRSFGLCKSRTARKINVKVDWFTKLPNCSINVYQLSLELFHTITVSPYTHFLMKSCTVHKPALVSLLVPGLQCQMKIAPGSPKVTYVRTVLWSRTRQPTHQTCLPLHVLGQPGRLWCGILSPRTPQALVAMFKR